MNLAKLEKKETPNHPGTTKLLEDVMNVECKKTCGTCSSFIDPQCTKTTEHFFTTRESLCLFSPSLWWSKVLPNPKAQLRGLREKMDSICGVDSENAEVLKLEIKKLKETIQALEKERNTYMESFQKTLAKNLEARKVLEEK